MAQYYNLQKVAEILGLSPAEVHQLRERNELHAYRDGSDWKFKVEDVEKRLAEQIKARGAAKKAGPIEEAAEDVLLSEVEVGPSDSGSSGAVIGGPEEDATTSGSDLRLADSEVRVAGSDIDLSEAESGEGAQAETDATVSDEGGQLDQDATVGPEEDLDLTLDEDATLEDSQVAPEKEEKVAGGSGSSLELSEELEDDDVVLGGSSGSGSDVTIGGDSGISLLDPADSGLSLEEPVDLVGGGDESLELGEDDMLAFTEEADSEAPTELRSDDDFLLTPLEEDTGEEDSESGSQVIALDTEEEGEQPAAVAAAPPTLEPMLEEELGAEEAVGIGAAAGLAPSVTAPMAAERQLAEGAPVVAPTAAFPEAPYSVWNVVGLAFCVIFLILTGMMVYDLLRNMWSWGGPYPINSSLMDTILGLLGG